MNMQLGLLTVGFHLYGCSSLKQKRQALAGARDRFGRLSHVAVCESDFHDSHDTAQWSFVVTGLSRQAVESTLNEIEQYLATRVDAVITSAEREFL